MTQHVLWHQELARCQRCGADIRPGQVRRRRDVVREQEIRHWDRFIPDRRIDYALVNLCPACCDDYDLTAYVRRQRRLSTIGGLGIGVLGCLWVGALGVVLAAVDILSGLAYWRAANITRVPQRRMP